ncbi:MAG: RHS repeat-associated core domain-containing protein, partial [Rubrivivax sp.]|nr:RHS repeat-associated core domain-containing protein [Rubrivivax sp.]
RTEPYGATHSGAVPQGIGFTGHVNDADTGLVYMQQRYYDPLTGRFLSVDPITTDAATGNTFNRYVYGNANPYKYVDPDGRWGVLAVRGAQALTALYRAVTTTATASAVAGGARALSEATSGSQQGGEKGGATEVKSPEIKPSDVAGKTAGEIGQLATDAGLKPKGPDPVGGKGSFVDPKTGEQRVLVHGDHAHVNDSAGNRLNVDGKKVPANSPEAHLPVKPDPAKNGD